MVSLPLRFPYRLILFPAFVIFFILASAPPEAEALRIPPLDQWSILVSLSRNLVERVANVRAERGDYAGAQRAQAVSEKLQLLRRRGEIWSLGWDYIRNSWWLGVGFNLPLSEVRQILFELRDLGGLRSEEEKTRWSSRNYARVRSLFGSVIRSLLGSFSKEGPLRETLVVLQKELVEGEFVKDCWDMVAKNLEGLATVATVARELLFSDASAVGLRTDGLGFGYGHYHIHIYLETPLRIRIQIPYGYIEVVTISAENKNSEL